MNKPSFLIAHRGLNTHHFENSRSAIIGAAKYTQWIEVDVVLTKDSYCIIQHDDSMKPLFDLELNVHSLEYQEILAIYEKRVGMNQLLTLAQLIGVCALYSLKLNLEIKSMSNEVVNQLLIAKVSDQLKSIPKSQLIISSFNHSLLPHFKQQGFDIALLFKCLKPNVIDKLNYYGAVGVHCAAVAENQEIESSLIGKIHAIGRYIAVYTVNDYRHLKALKAHGIDAVFTDNVQLMSCCLSNETQ
jgi:glycerophosphoryl diester phosphodiesterase